MNHTKAAKEMVFPQAYTSGKIIINHQAKTAEKWLLNCQDLYKQLVDA